MAMLGEIPYLDHATIAGRFLSCLTFYDEGDWHFWMLAGEPGDQHLFKMKGWPAEAVYFAREPVEAGDLYLPSIDFTGRIACYSELQRRRAASGTTSSTCRRRWQSSSSCKAQRSRYPTASREWLQLRSNILCLFAEACSIFFRKYW